MAEATTANLDLNAVYDALMAQHDALHDLFVDTKDSELSDALLNEMQEITHRLDLVQSQLFTKRSKDLTAQVKQVKQANADLTQALVEVKSVTDLVDACTAFLTIVDQVIDLAKVL